MARRKLIVAVTGPTGEIGRPFIRALERSREVGEIRGMARRPFQPEALGWRRASYVQGDILDRAAVEDFVAGADVVVHLAFVIFADDPEQTRRINLDGSANVFRAAVAAGAKRLAYTSSVAAYGFRADNPQPLVEDLPPRGSKDLYYSAQKAELEATMAQALRGSAVDGYVFRPCVVAGPESPALVARQPYVQASAALPGPLRRLLGAVPTPAPVLPDFGVPFQLVHGDDVATAVRAAVLGRGEPGVYNLAGRGELSISDLARELGWHSVPVPKAAVDVTAEVLGRVPLVSPRAEWLHALRTPMIMDAGKARRSLRWRARHDALETLRQTVAAAREEGILR